MLKKLRHKFIFINMLLVTLVLLLTFSAIVLVNHNQRLDEVNNALRRDLAKSTSFSYIPYSFNTPSGLVPGNDIENVITGAEEIANDTGMSTVPTEDSLEDLGDESLPRGTGSALIEFGSPGGYIATSCYRVESSGNVTELADSLGLSSSQASTAAQEALSTGKESGRLSDQGLYYRYRTDEHGTRIAFASTEYVDETTLRLARTLTVVGLMALGVFFIISIFLARWALRPVERAWKQQRQFVADASHELKTPLTVILANNSILMKHPEKTVGSQMRWIESTQTEAKLMQELVGDLLFLAQPEDTERPEVIGTVDFSALVEAQALQFESVAFEQELVLDESIEPGIQVKGNPAKLQRLAGTLIDNACKYGEKGSTVSIKLYSNGERATYSVNSHGEVISPEDLPHIFDRFWRADKARVRTAGGYGLGLAIAKEVADELHGEISATSTAEGGTTFKVVLPVS